MYIYNCLTFGNDLIQDGSHSSLVLPKTKMTQLKKTFDFTENDLNFGLVQAESHPHPIR